MRRPSWDSYFLEIAKQVATRGTCNRLQVGCVIAKENEVVATGYNGSVHGHDHCLNVGCLLNDQGRCIRTVHAEINAVLHADRDKLKGATAYCTHEPCENCTKHLNQVGIVRVVFVHEYENKWNKHFSKGMQWISYNKPKCKHERTFTYNHGYHTICQDCGVKV